MDSSDPLIDTTKHPLILFDGVCNLCNGSVLFIIKRDPNAKFKFASLQSSAAQLLLKGFDVSSKDLYSIILIKNGKIYDRSDAILEIAKDISGVWRFFYAFKIIPAFLRNLIYKLVANNRYRVFGKKDQCMIPTPELRSRFLE